MIFSSEDSSDTLKAPKRLRKLRELIEKGRCSICMDYIINEQGQLECNHNQFCLSCIMNWSKLSNKCPLCMQKFFWVTNLASKELLLVEDRGDDSEEISSNYENTMCEVCGLGDNEDSLLLCDGCDEGFHIYCLNITQIPNLENWFCSECIQEQPEDAQILQSIEIMKIQREELPKKRLRRNGSASPVSSKPRRSERLKKPNDYLE